MYIKAFSEQRILPNPQPIILFCVKTKVKTHGGNEDKKVGLAIESVVDQQEIMIKPLAETKVNVKGYSSFTILGNGRVIPVLDLSHFISQENSKQT